MRCARNTSSRASRLLARSMSSGSYSWPGWQTGHVGDERRVHALGALNRRRRRKRPCGQDRPRAWHRPCRCRARPRPAARRLSPWRGPAAATLRPTGVSACRMTPERAISPGAKPSSSRPVDLVVAIDRRRRLVDDAGLAEHGTAAPGSTVTTHRCRVRQRGVGRQVGGFAPVDQDADRAAVAALA